MNEDFKKTVIKEVCRMVINIITAAMVAFGITSCASMDFECQGSYCVKKKADTSTIMTTGTVTAQTV